MVLGARYPERGRQAAGQLDPAGQRVIPRQLDVADPASVQALARWVSEQLGRTDVVVNNAAVHYGSWQRAGSADLDIVEQALQTSLLGAWRTTRALLPLPVQDALGHQCLRGDRPAGQRVRPGPEQDALGGDEQLLAHVADAA